MQSQRRLEILRAIVDEYVATQEPVGSKSIADKSALGLSPATIRNEMAVLEDEGLITHPHTSAGAFRQIWAIASSWINWQLLSLYHPPNVVRLKLFWMKQIT